MKKAEPVVSEGYVVEIDRLVSNTGNRVAVLCSIQCIGHRYDNAYIERIYSADNVTGGTSALIRLSDPAIAREKIRARRIHMINKGSWAPEFSGKDRNIIPEHVIVGTEKLALFLKSPEFFGPPINLEEGFSAEMASFLSSCDKHWRITGDFSMRTAQARREALQAQLDEVMRECHEPMYGIFS